MTITRVELDGTVTVIDEDAPLFEESVGDNVTIIYPVDLWSRLTNTEAEAVEAAMSSQPIRIQNIFRSASSYRSDHELWPLLVAMATTLFGADRAQEILIVS